MNMKKEAVASFIALNILGSQEVQDILMINRSRLKALVESGKLKPIKELKRENLYLLSDVEALKKELLLDTRSNVYKHEIFPTILENIKKELDENPKGI